MKRVVHIGPVSSKGGMATAIRELVQSTPSGWVSGSIDTFSEEGPIFKLRAYLLARRRLKEMNKNGQIDVAHIHVTHSLSWFRKRRMIRLCDRLGVKVVVHIHSGKFDSFCKGLAGRSVKKELGRKNRSVVVLEKRWLGLLKEWIPSDSVVIPNFVKSRNSPKKRIPTSGIRILMLSRDSNIKGHRFALEIHEELKKRGREVKMVFTGISRNSELRRFSSNEGLKMYDWVPEEEKISLLEEADFVLSPSSYEGSSITVIESIMRCVPCLCSPASAETIGVESLILEMDDPKRWADRIDQISEPSFYNHIVKLILKEQKKYDYREIRKEWGRLYDKLVSDTFQ